MQNPTGMFEQEDLFELRGELMQHGLDSFQTAQMVAVFLSQRGYGVSTQAARSAATRIEASGFELPNLEKELERIAWTM